MKRITSALLLLTLWLGACTASPTAAPVESTQPPAAAQTAQAESAPTENSQPAGAGREAIVSEFEGQVTVREASDAEFIPAEVGFIIHTGGALQTGGDGRARLDLQPEGTIVRVAPNSAFTLPQLSEENGEPKSTISLFFGKIFILLNGGSLDVQTASGVASVRGSLMSVSNDPASGRMQISCLEGHCVVTNEDGEEMEIPEGDSGFVTEDGEIVEFDGIDQDEVEDWLEEAGGEVEEFLGEMPDPNDYPEIEKFEEYDFDPSEYYEQMPMDDGEGFYWQFDESILPYGEDFGNGTEPAPTDDGLGISTEVPTDLPTDLPTDIPTEEPTSLP